SVAPPDGHLLQYLSQNGVKVTAIGKISDIFAGSGVTRSVEAHGNAEVMQALMAGACDGDTGFFMANLVDFDMVYGHRRDVRGFAAALEEADRFLQRFCAALGENDWLIVTADHGCDPTFTGTDHTREYTPVLLWNKTLQAGYHLGTRHGFTGIAATVAQLFGLPHRQYGESYRNEEENL
ncbi:MAG: alkaline phosphatase family protein, partial [Eubacteriales bacterium]|nr:alkaline phosphatase family protein [Eubacteriales bacterium]